MLGFDPLNNFHLHANMYHIYKSGTKTTPDEYTDMITMNQGEEFKYKYPGKYMFHAHKTEFAEKGWMGLFLVRESGEYNNSSNTNYNLTNNNKDTEIVMQFNQ